MKQNKIMHLGALLAVMLLVAVAFVPEAMAKTEREKSNFSDPVVVQALMDKFVKEGANNEKFFEKLSPEEQSAVMKAMKVDKIIINRTEGEVSINGNICNSPRIEVRAYNWLGMSLWTYIQQISRCYDGSILTEASRTRSGAAFVPYWQFAEHIDSTESAGAGQSSYRAYTQGKFTNCLYGVCTGDERYPYIDMIVYGNGNFWSNSGGGGTI